MASNIKKNTAPSVWKQLGYVVLGGIFYPVLPTAIQGIFKIDMSGWKGVLTGGLGGVALGAALDKPAMSAGAAGAAITHIMYVKANDTIGELLGTPIFRFDKDSQLFDDLPPGIQEVALPNGQKILAEIPQGQENTVNDYVAQLPGQNLNDYTAEVPSAAPRAMQTMNDFVGNVPGTSLSDPFTPKFGF